MGAALPLGCAHEHSRIRLALKEARYEYSIHALEEMDEDQLVDSALWALILCSTNASVSSWCAKDVLG